MKTISHFVISVFDLIEAEGRDLRSTVRAESSAAYAAICRFAIGMVFLLVSIPLFAGAILLVAAGCMWWLETHLSRPVAALLTGVAILIVAALCLLIFKSLTAKRDP